MDKEGRKYWIEYIYPSKNGIYSKAEEEILEEFNPQIPEGAIGYRITYGTWTVRYSSYSVYKGEVISFKEAREKFGDKKICCNITAEMIKKTVTTEELKKDVVKNENCLQARFKEFVEKCNKMTIPKSLLEDNAEEISLFIPAKGIVILSTNLFQKFYPGDVILN